MNDTIGCFHRIDHTLVIFVLIRYGLDYESARILFQVMKKTLHTIKTGYRISDPICGDKMIPPAGHGQGNAVGPTLWALVSPAVIKMCKETELGIEIATAITKMILSLISFAFIDNADLVQTASNQDTSRKEMIDKFQESLEDGKVVYKPLEKPFAQIKQNGLLLTTCGKATNSHIDQ